MDTSNPDFKQRVANNGVKTKNVPNLRFEEGKFEFTDYVAKDVTTWAFVPDNPEDVDVESYADEMYEVYQPLEKAFDEVTVERDEDEHYLVQVTVDIPDDSGRQERIAEEVAEAILQRNQM